MCLWVNLVTEARKLHQNGIYSFIVVDENRREIIRLICHEGFIISRDARVVYRDLRVSVEFYVNLARPTTSIIVN